MKLPKRILQGLLLILALLLAGGLSIPIINNINAASLERELRDIPLPPRTERVEDFHAAGKLAGNGNGMQYCAVILLRSELSLKELQAHYAQYGEYSANLQQDKWIPIEHESRPFASLQETVNFDSYYTICIWEEADSWFLNRDLRAH